MVETFSGLHIESVRSKKHCAILTDVILIGIQQSRSSKLRLAFNGSSGIGPQCGCQSIRKWVLFGLTLVLAD